MIPTINKPTRVTQKTTTAIDHILTNSFPDTVFKTANFKSDVFYHFPIYFMIPSSMKQATQKIPSYLKEYLTKNQLSYLKSIKSIKSTKSTKRQTSDFLLLRCFYAHKNVVFFVFVCLCAFCAFCAFEIFL